MLETVPLFDLTNLYYTWLIHRVWFICPSVDVICGGGQSSLIKLLRDVSRSGIFSNKILRSFVPTLLSTFHCAVYIGFMVLAWGENFIRWMYNLCLACSIWYPWVVEILGVSNQNSSKNDTITKLGLNFPRNEHLAGFVACPYKYLVDNYVVRNSVLKTDSFDGFSNLYVSWYFSCVFGISHEAKIVCNYPWNMSCSSTMG